MPIPSSYQEAYSAVKTEANKSSDYKCLVTVFLYGGCDTHCVLIPRENNPNRAVYDQNRKGESLTSPPFRTGVNVDEAPLNPLNETGNDDPTGWRTHPKLTVFKELWDDGDLAFIKDLGVVNKPTTRQSLENDPETKVKNSFSHQHQQQQMQECTDFKNVEINGVFGRVNALFDPYYLEPNSSSYPPIYNPDQTVDSCVYTVTGTNYQTVSYSPSPFNTYPPILKDGLERIDCDRTYTDKVGELMSHTYDGPDNPGISSNSINSSFVQIYSDNSKSQQKLNENVQELDQELNDIFNGFLNSPDIGSEDIDSLPYYISVFKNVAKIIQSRSTLGQRRQMIFVGVGSWDHHATVRPKIDGYLTSLNAGIAAFVEFLKHPDVNLFDNVVINHSSDFSRTLRSNSNSGTDHSWSMHGYVIGGSVNGRAFYPTGYECNYDLSGPKSEGSSSGRYIPEVSSDQLYAKILNWFGVPEAQLGLVLPGLKYHVQSNNLNFIFPSGNYSLNFI